MDATYFVWTPDSGENCTAASGTCYASAEIHIDAIDIDWASPANVLNLQVPSRLITLTSEPDAPTDGTAVPTLSLPAMEGFTERWHSMKTSVTLQSRNPCLSREAQPTTPGLLVMSTWHGDYLAHESTTS